jgi:hypothetical protein
VAQEEALRRAAVTPPPSPGVRRDPWGEDARVEAKDNGTLEGAITGEIAMEKVRERERERERERQREPLRLCSSSPT